MSASQTSHCFLIGYRGCGKSSIGQRLAKRLGRPFIDTDREVEREAKTTIAEIFAREGESGFRDRETRALRNVVTSPPSVIATGGGMILRPENRDAMKQHGLVFWLQASPDELWRRIHCDSQSASTRPALTDLPGPDEVRQLLDSRSPCYRETAHHVITTDGRSLNELVTEILDWMTPLAKANGDSEPRDVLQP